MSRQLDAAIAGALGYKVGYSLLEYPEGEDCDYWVDELNVRLPHYSTDGNAMIELDREMQEQGYCFRHIFINGANDFKVTYYTKNDDSFIGRAITMPLALALAAYKALMGMSEG